MSEDLAVYSRKLRPSLKRPAIIAAIVLGLVLLGCTGGWWWMIRMPGASYDGPHEPRAEERELAAELRRDVEKLSVEIGVRHDERPDALGAAAQFVDDELAAAGLTTRRHSFEAGMTFHNIEGTLAGRGEEIVVVGAHYDSSRESPAANDNGSGVAALLALARRMAGTARSRTIRFVGFANEEPPHFQKDSMGSLVYARACRDRGDAIVAMLSLETIGFTPTRTRPSATRFRWRSSIRRAATSSGSSVTRAHATSFIARSRPSGTRPTSPRRVPRSRSRSRASAGPITGLSSRSATRR